MPHRSEQALRRRQERGELRVRTAAAFRELAEQAGLAEAYDATDVVVAADAGFTDQGTLQLGLGPSEPPIRMRDAALNGVAATAAGGAGDLVLTVATGGARVLADLLGGGRVDLLAAGEGTRLQPRRELHTSIGLGDIGTGRLLLSRAIGENGVVAVSSAEGVVRSSYGPLVGPFGNALYDCAGADSIGLAMPGLGLLGPGSPVLVGGAIGWVVGPGSGHQPNPRRLPGGHACTPGAVAAVCVDLHDLRPEWVRACRFEGQGEALLVAIAAPIPLLDGGVAGQAATGNATLVAPVLDVSIPRRIKPSLGSVTYAELHGGRIEAGGQRLRAAPTHSPRLAATIAAELVERLRQGTFPLRLPLGSLGQRPGMRPLEV
jgi:uncharacterized protein (DUF39 family)